MLRALVFFVALTAGGIAAWLTLGMQGNEAPAATIVAPAPQVPTQEILVAAVDLPHGEILSGENLRWQAWPDEATNPGFISRTAKPDALKAMSGATVRSRFIAGEPIREEKLSAAGAGFLSANLPKGKRAVAVRISAENTAGGFILPNDHVDVLHTVGTAGDNGGQGSNVSRTILRNIPVLAIDQRADEAEADSVIGKTATLELDPKQTEIITAAEASGALSLSLRSVADNGEIPQAEVPAPTKRSHTVRIFRAGHGELVKTQ